MSDDIWKLLSLAWERCERDVFDAIRLYIGGLLALSAFVFLFFLNFYYNAYPHIEVQFLPYFTASDALFIAAEYAFVNTFFTLTFILIVVLLFEYTLSFTIVCYYYDNCSWVVVNTIRGVTDSILKSFERNREIREASAKKSRDDLQSRIAKIRKPDEL